MTTRPPTGHVTIMHDGKLQLGVWKAGTVRRSDGTLIAANVERADEGVRWIRGWYDAGTPEGKALLAAHALRPEDPMHVRASDLMGRFYRAWPQLEHATRRR